MLPGIFLPIALLSETIAVLAVVATVCVGLLESEIG